MAAQIESGELAPGTRLPSGDELARTMGINRNTAHRAIEELQRRGLVIRRQGSGSVVSERAGRKGARIALLVDGYSAFHNFPAADLLQGIQDRIGEESTLIIADSKHDAALEAKQLRRLSRETEGILVYVTSPEKNPGILALRQESFPIVALDRVPHDVDVDAAVTDNRGAARDITRKMISHGHRRVAFLGFHKPSFSSVSERYDGYAEAMVEAGLSAEEFTRWLPAGIEATPQIYRQLMRDTLVSLRFGPNQATALFCVEDLLGVLAVSSCEQLGLAIPQDLEIATFNDWHPMTLKTPWSVHRVVQNKYELGKAAADLVLDRAENPHRASRTVRVPADLAMADETLLSSLATH